MQHAKYRIILAVTAIIIIITTALVINYNFQNNLITNKENEDVPAYQYLLREYEEKIGVFEIGQEKPFKTLDVFVTTLPAFDRQELATGIMVQNEEKLNRLIEDYES